MRRLLTAIFRRIKNPLRLVTFFRRLSGSTATRQELRDIKKEILAAEISFGISRREGSKLPRSPMRLENLKNWLMDIKSNVIGRKLAAKTLPAYID